jgi:glycine/D-amino acid oxidase-like deaminating enzyme
MRDEAGLVYELARKHGIECDAVQAGYMQVAHKESLVRYAEKKAKRWRDRGFEVRFVDRDEVVRRTGSERFHAGAVDELGGRINPFLFTRGLVEAGLRNGMEAHARSPVTSVRRVGARWRVATKRGAVDAERVVVCTNGYTGGCVPELERTWCPLLAWAMALRPLPGGQRDAILPGGTVICQVPGGFHPTLVDGSGRIVTASLPSPWRPHRSQAPLRWARRWLEDTFSPLREIALEVESYWTGVTAWSADELPRIFEVEPGLHALLCFSGEGNFMAPLLGRHLASALLRDRTDDLALPVQKPSKVRWRGRYDFGLRKIAVPLMNAAERLGVY